MREMSEISEVIQMSKLHVNEKETSKKRKIQVMQLRIFLLNALLIANVMTFISKLLSEATAGQIQISVRFQQVPC